MQTNHFRWIFCLAFCNIVLFISYWRVLHPAMLRWQACRTRQQQLQQQQNSLAVLKKTTFQFNAQLKQLKTTYTMYTALQANKSDFKSFPFTATYAQVIAILKQAHLVHIYIESAQATHSHSATMIPQWRFQACGQYLTIWAALYHIYQQTSNVLIPLTINMRGEDKQTCHLQCRLLLHPLNTSLDETSHE